MEEERVKKGAKGRPSTSMSYSGSESESDEMKMVVDSRNEDKSSTAENTAKDDGQEEVEEEEEEEEEEESDEEEEDDEEEEESDDDDDIGVINKKSRKKMTILESESSDDGEGDDCPICLNRLKYQDIGTPEACDHNFCLDCIQLWARNVNTCPVDRREFQLILARHANEDEIFKRIPVSGKSCQNEDDDGDVNQDFTYCELCGRSDREDRLLLCDGCDLGFHCECLDPPLDSVPVEEWFCPDCAEANTQRSGRMLNDLDDMQYLLEENSIDGIPYLRPRRRQIARTRISERVRARIQEYREGLARLVCDDEEPEASDEEGQGPSTRLSRTRSQTRQSEAKRKQSSRKKTKKGTTGKQKSYPKKKLRRRTKTPGKAQIFDRLRNASTSKSPKSRLAGKLGLTKPRMSLRKSDRATAARILKEDLYGAKPLSIMGRKHDLDPFPDDDSHSRLDEPQASTSVFSAAAAKRASKYSASALLSRQPVARPLLCKLPEDNQGSNFFSSHCSNSGASSAASSSGGLDLLGSIMMDQNLLHLESKDVKINRDGSLTAKKAITASAVKEPKKKKQTSTLFFDSKEDENSSGHSDDDERNFGSSKVAASAGRRLGGRNNNNNDDNDDNATASQVDCEEKESSEQIESETEMKCSDTEPRDSDSETKPSTFESANEMSVPVNDDDEDDDDDEEEAQEEEEETQDEEKEEKNESENVEDSFESNEADKAVENENVEENDDSCSRDSPAEVGLHSQTSELNDENVSPQKEDADQSYNSEAEDENENEEEEEDKEEEEEEEEENVEEEENAEEEEDDEKVTYKDEQKDDNLSEHVEEEEEEEKAVSEEEKAASEVGSSGFSPAPSGSPGEKSRDAEQNSDAEEAKEEEEFLSDEETARKDAVEKMDESAEVSESVQDEQQAVSDADDTEDDDVTGKEDDEDSAKSDAEEIKDADESGSKSDAEDKDAELEVKSDAEDKDAELEVKSDAEDKDAELEVKSDVEDKDAELEVKSDVEDKDAELEVKSDAEDKDAELEVKSDAEDLDTQEPAEEMSILVKSDAEEENVLKETEEEEEETEVSEDVNKFATEEEEEEENSPDLGTMQDDTLPSESEKTEEQEFPKPEDEDDDNCEALATENQPDQNEEEEEKEGKLEVADEASENFDDAASKNSEEMVKTHHEESETFEEQNEVGDEEVTAASGSESGMSSAGNEEEEEEEEEEEDEEEEKPKVPISELPRIPKRNRREGYRREKSSKGDGPELKSVLGRVDMPEYKMGRSWDKKDSRRSRWDPDDWSQSERDVDCASNRDRKSEGGKSYHSDRSESSRDSEKYPFEYKESKSRKRRRERSRSRSRGRKESAVEYRDIPHRRHSPERSKSRRRDRSRNRSRSGSREKSFDYDKSHKRKSRGRSRDRSQSRKSRRHRSYSRSPSRKRDKERGSADKRRHRDERKRGGEERGHKRHSDKSDPEESRKKRQSHEEYEDWDDGSCQVVDFDESTSPKGTTGKKAADCFYESHSSNEKLNENFFNRRTPQEKGAFKGDKMEESGAFYNARGSSKKHKFVDRFYKAPHMRTVGTEKFPIHLSEDEGDEMGVSSKSHRSEHDDGGQDSGDSEYDPAFPTESGSPLREEAAEEAAKQSEEPVAPPVVVTATAPTVTTAAAVVSAAATEEIASSGPIDETPPSGSQSILGDSGYMIAENPNLQNIPIQPQNITFPMGIRMMPPGMQPGMPQHLLMNPMFLNRPPPFSRLPRISGPVGRLGWSMNPSGIMQIPPNRFGPTRMGPGGGMPPRPGLLNGGFEGMPQEPGQPMPPFKQHPCDPRNIPSHTAGHQGPPGQIPRPGLAGHPPPHMSHIHPPGPLLPHPQQHPPPPPPSSQQMHIPPPTSDTLSSSSLDSQNAPLHMQHGLGKSQPSSDDKSVPSNFCVPELNQITKLLEAHTQALQNKQRNTSSSLQGGDIDVFKIPLPPMAPPSIPPPTLGLPLVPPPDTHNYTSTTKSYKNGQSRLLANSHLTSEIASESTEVVDMDVASPLDDEVAIELPASPELDDIDESKINMKDSSVIELSVPEDMPASAVELTNLTNKEKHTSRVKKSNPKASQQRTVSPTSTKTSYMGYMKKLQIQERVVDEVKLAIKPFYSGKKIDKNEYKEILRKAVPKICHSKSGNINPAKIKALIEAYVDKMCKTRRYMERKKKGSLKANGERIKKPSR